MTKWFEMSDSFYRCCNRLFIGNTSRSEFYRHLKSLANQIFQHLDLNLSHDFCGNLLRPLIPHHMQLRLFFFKLTQL